MDPGPSEKQVVRVTIYNQAYTLRASAGAAETEALAASVDELMSAIATRAGNADTTHVAVLACLHLADRLRALEREFEAHKTRVATTSEHLSLLLDETAGEAQET